MTNYNDDPNLVRLARAIAKAEGYGIPDAKPTRLNNPGDLTTCNGLLVSFESEADGWQALFHQLGMIAYSVSKIYRPDMTLQQISQIWVNGAEFSTPDSVAWLSIVCNFLHVTQDLRFSDLVPVRGKVTPLVQ